MSYSGDESNEEATSLNDSDDEEAIELDDDELNDTSKDSEIEDDDESLLIPQVSLYHCKATRVKKILE